MLLQRKHPMPCRHYRNHHQPRLSQQRGVVIVVALFIVALVATMAYVMMSRLERDTRRTTLLLRDIQAEFYAQGSLAWAIDQLRNDWEKKKPNELVDKTPIVSPENVQNGYKIVSTIYDMQGRFNLNSVGVAESQLQFKKLIQMANPGLSQEKVVQLVMALVDWISFGSNGEGSKYYLELPIPYRPAHRLLQSVSELRLVRGMTPPLFNALQPYVTALPAATKINVQSAAAPVLAALSPTLTLEAAKAIEKARAEMPFKTVDVFNNLDIVKNHNIPVGSVVVISSYFLVETNVTIENQHLVLYTLLERSEKEGKAVMTILWQSKGIW